MSREDMKSAFLFLALLFCTTAHSQDITGRVNISKQIMKIYQQECQTDDENMGEATEIRSAFELAASYIIHGEYNDMKEQLLKAKSMSEERDCHTSIDDFLN